MTPSVAVPRKTLALTSVLVTAAVAASLATSSSSDSSGAQLGHTGASVGGASWAHDLSGKVVSVTPTHYLTPIHPELVTHPESDDMGSGMTAMALASASTPSPASTPATIPDLASMVAGIDVSSHQPSIDWSKVAPHVNFVYAKATEGTYYRNVDFTNQYDGPYDYGVIRGAYHFAVPNNSTGTAQADYFVAHGGGWSADGKTLPGALDIEYNPYGATCYGLSQASMRSWISAFLTRYHNRTGRWAVIYTTTDWWTACTGNYSGFWANSPLWLARYASAPGTLPAGAPTWSFWQYSSSGPFAGDSDEWNGALSQLKVLACNGSC